MRYKTADNIPLHIIDALRPIGEYFDLGREGDDLVIEGCIDWNYAGIERVAMALGTKDIDITSVERFEEGLPLERDGGGCATCGFGDRLIVRGVFKP
jgi:hypothetical protein